MKPRVPPVIIQKRLLGSSSSESSKRKSTTDSSDTLKYAATVVQNRPRLLPSLSHNANGDEIGIIVGGVRGTPAEKIIPKLSDSPPNLGDVDPFLWDIPDVSEFLRANDCGAYCDSFERNVRANHIRPRLLIRL